MSKPAPAATVRAAIAALRKEHGWTPSGLISLLKGGGNSSKGSGYERELCKRLSLWWTADERDDVFWRSSGSGARAKVRGRAGRATMGQHGDVAATDPIGAPLIDLLTIEIKRGYSEYTFQDVVDRPKGGGVQQWEQWFAQALESNEQAGSFSWLLITRRDRREALVWMPAYLFVELRKVGAFKCYGVTMPLVRLHAMVRQEGGDFTDVEAVCVTLDMWLDEVTPEMIKEMAEVA